jgi:ligand-binding sensor domain-containing protein/DNA-binding CsgD family transcriptional regulator
VLYCECGLDYSPSSMSALSEDSLLAMVAPSLCFLLPLYRVQLALFHRFTEDMGTIVTFSQIVYNQCFYRIGNGSVLLRLLSTTITIVFFSLNSLLADDQPIRFNHLTVKDGLTMNAVHSILEDSQGFMWFGTRLGLNRYDGSEFKAFLYDPLNENSIPGSWITVICEDAASVLWIGTKNGGFSRYDRVQESFKNFAHDPDNPNSLVSDHITCLFPDSRGALWVGTEHGLSRYDPDSHKFTTFRHDPDTSSIAQDRIMTLAETPGGRLWVGTENGAASVISLDDFSINQKVQVRPSTSISLTAMLADTADQCLWLGRIGMGLYRWDYNEDKFDLFYDRDTPVTPIDGITSISKDKNGTLWFGSAGGLANYNHDTKEFTYYYHDANDPGSLGDNLIYSTLVDRQGILWVTTASGGVSYYDPGLIRFQLRQSDPDNINSIRANAVYSISQDPLGNIWFGTVEGGTSVMDATTGAFTHYNSIKTLGVTEWWSRDFIARVRSDRNHKIWIGTFTCGLFTLDYPTQTLNHYRNRENEPNSFGDKTTRDILETRDGSIWIGTEAQGLERYNELTDDFEHFKNDPDNPQSLSSNFTYCLLEDKAGYIWIGTADGGLNQFDRVSNTFKRFEVARNNSNSITSNCVTSLYEDSEQTLWIGTRSGGLNKLNKARTQFSTLDLHSSLKKLSIYGILQDDHRFLWLSTNQGILKAHPDSGLVTDYTASDGVQETFYFLSSLEADNGLMYFGGGEGYNVFHPDSIKNNQYIPPVVLTGLAINYEDVAIGETRNGRIILNKSITQTDKLKLDYRDKVITFKFSALNFSASYKNHYSYKLVGYDEDWIDANNTPKAQYMNLPAGEYKFRGRGSNNDGVWNVEGASIEVSIAPPFWKTWWFKTLGIVTLLGLILVYIQLRTYRLIAQRDKLEALVRERTAQLHVEIEERQRVEMEKAELKLDHLKRELLTQSLHLNDKQRIMDNLQSELESFSKLSWNDVKPRIKKLLRFLRDRSSVKQDWEDFEIWFTEIHTGFYSELRSSHPMLSENELKVCALLRLNLISKDIAKVMNVQPSSIDIYRHRIRKKLEIGGDENLSTFLSKY